MVSLFLGQLIHLIWWLSSATWPTTAYRLVVGKNCTINSILATVDVLGRQALLHLKGSPVHGAFLNISDQCVGVLTFCFADFLSHLAKIFINYFCIHIVNCKKILSKSLKNWKSYQRIIVIKSFWWEKHLRTAFIRDNNNFSSFLIFVALSDKMARRPEKLNFEKCLKFYYHILTIFLFPCLNSNIDISKLSTYMSS